MQLITPFEVLKYSPAGFDYPTASFCELIPQIEQELERQCLGCDLYNYLIDHLSTYPTNATEYDPNTSYSIGDVVINYGCTFTSLEDNNTDNPSLDTGKWEVFKRFDTAGANELWAGYLRFIIALKVYSASLTFTTWRSGANGISINAGDGTGYRSATKTELVGTNTALTNLAERSTENMIKWLRLNAVAKSLPWTDCADDCKTTKTASRRFAFRT